MSDRKGLIKYIIIIAVILAAIFFSQQAYSRDALNSFFTFIKDNAGAYLLGGFKKADTTNATDSSTKTNENLDSNSLYLSNGSTSVFSGTDSYISDTNIAPVDTLEAEKWSILDIPKMAIDKVKSGGEAVVNGINNTKEKISENISNTQENISNYFSGIANSILHPETTTNCPPAASSN